MGLSQRQQPTIGLPRALAAFAIGLAWLLVGTGCGDDPPAYVQVQIPGPAAIEGEWRLVESIDASACGEFLNPTTDIVAIEQDGTRITLRTQDAVFVGTRTGNALTWAGEYWFESLQGWLTVTNVAARVSDGGNRISGSATFVLRETRAGPVVCSGAVTFDATRAPPVLPLAPANLTAATTSSTSIRLSWSDRSENESGFRINMYEVGTEAPPRPIGQVAANIRLFDASGLAPDTSYRFHVQAFNASGESAPSNTAEATTDPQPAGPPPTDVEAGPVFRTYVGLRWVDQAADTTAFHVYRGPSAAQTDTLIEVVDAGSTSYLDGPLTPETHYAYRVSAVGPHGESAKSEAAETTTLRDVSGSWLMDVLAQVPGCNTYYSTSGRSATLTRPPGNPPAVELMTDIGRLAGFLNSNETIILNTGTIGIGGYQGSLQAVGLVIAPDGRSMTGQGGIVLACPQLQGGAVQIVLERPEPPVAPTNLRATATSSTVVALEWTDESSTEEAFRVHRRTTTGVWEQIAVLGAGARSYEDRTVSPATSYEYRVVAENASGTSPPSNVAFVTTPTAGTPPPAPQQLAATALSSSSVRLTWLPVTGADRIFVYRGPASGTLVKVAETSGSATSYLDTGLAPGTTYRYEVSAQNQHGESGRSNRVSVTTQAAGSPPAAPSNLQATAVSTSQIDLAWTDNSQDETGFRVQIAQPGLPFTNLKTVGINVWSTSVTGLAPDTTYSFRVLAFNDFGDSAYSNSAAATTFFEAECTPGAQHCVAGNPGVVEACVGGRWTETACPDFHICSMDACRLACDYVPEVAGESAICFVPNGDGVNDTILFTTNDPAHLTPLGGAPYTAILVAGASTGRTFDSSNWPYAWTIAPGGLDYVRIGFRLDQFSIPPLRRIRFEFRTRAAGIFDSASYVVARGFDSDNNIVVDGQEYSYLDWRRLYLEKLPVTPYFSTAPGTTNLFSATGIGGFSDPPHDLLEINYVLLRIYP